jgi:two-component system response regulator YesN
MMRSRRQQQDAADLFLREHFQRRDVSLVTVAAALGLSNAYVSRLFKECGGFRTRLTQCRLRAAEEMLKSSSIPIKEIAYLSGFASAACMTRAFRRCDGRAPRELRYGQDDSDPVLTSVRLPTDAVRT